MLVKILYAIAYWGLLLLCVPQATAQAIEPLPAQGTRQAVYVFADRTDRHAKYSKSEVFHSVVDDTFAFLRENRVSMAVDEFGGRFYSENPTPLETILNIARDAHATSVLHLNVDRPFTKWIKVTVRCYDMEGKPLWEGKAESGGGLSGAHGLEVTKKRLHELLKKRLGREGLPILPSEPTPAAAAPQTVKSGTPE